MPGSLIALLLAPVAVAQNKDLAALTLEDFLDVDVTSVDRSSQKLTQSAAAVYVISGEDILRSGATNLPEALRLAPGVNVAHGGNQWVVSIRGFGNIYSNKLLVLVDGRTTYNSVYSGVLWSENLMMLEDIDRIEIIRGPGATVWGANAVNGVINVITKKATRTVGGLVTGAVGSDNPGRVGARYGSTMGSAGAWRAWGQFSAFGAPQSPRLGPMDGWSTRRGGMRFDWDLGARDSFIVEGEAGHAACWAPFSDGFAPVAVRSQTTYGYAVARWTHQTLRGDNSTLQVSASSEEFDGAVFSASLRVFDADWNYGTHLGKHHVIFGAGGRADVIESHGTDRFFFSPANATYGIGSGFVQDEWHLVPGRLLLTLGSKFEKYSKAGSSAQPTARLMWMPNRTSGYWVSASRAVRIPSHVDYAVHIRTGQEGIPFRLDIQGNPDFRSETLYAFEAGARFQLRKSTTVDIAAFRQHYYGLQSFRLQPLTPAQLAAIMTGQQVALSAPMVPGMNGLNQGVEATVRYQPRPWWRLEASYSSLFAGLSYRRGYSAPDTVSVPMEAPQHQGMVRSAWDFRRNWTADVAVYQVSRLKSGLLPAHTRIDFRVARKLGESVELSVSGQDVLRSPSLDFIADAPYPSGLIKRGIEAGVRWQF